MPDFDWRLPAPDTRCASCQFDGTDVILPPSAFLQATAASEQALTDFVLSRLGASRRAADLFCGIGTFTFPLARRLSVLAVDLIARALDALTLAYRNGTGLKPIEAQKRNLFREPLTARELDGIDLVLFDPPRQGAEAQARQIAASRCSRMWRCPAILTPSPVMPPFWLPVDTPLWRCCLSTSFDGRLTSKLLRSLPEAPRRADEPRTWNKLK